jgi:glycerate-2-kinase
MRILNADTLTTHGNVRARKAIIEILEAGLQAADPYNNTKKLVRIEGNRLIIGHPDMVPAGAPQTGDEIIDLAGIGRIFVFGAGKGVQRIALALEEILGDHLTGGHVVAKHGDDIICIKIGVTLGGHPVPDIGCAIGSRKILDMSRGMRPNDLVFTIACNGVSSLLTLPVEGVTIEEAAAVTRMMQIERGVPTGDLNTIRNHIDQMKSGRATRHMQPARCIHIMGIDPASWDWILCQNVWQHFLPDCSTFADAVAAFKKWDAWEAAPASVRRHLLRADPRDETIKADEWQAWRSRVFGVMPHKIGFLPTGMRMAEELGYTPVKLAAFMRAEASQAGLVIADIALNCEKEGVPFAPPCSLFSSGEIVVTVGKETGVGGRNQEYALSAATRIAGSANVVMAAVDTDGTDGPGGRFADDQGSLPCLAGGVVDGRTMSEATALGVDVWTALRQHATSAALWKLKSGIAVAQNVSVNDFAVTLVDRPGVPHP